MQKLLYQDKERICVRCKEFPGVSDYQYHCLKCHQEIQGNQGNPFFQPDVDQQQNNEDAAKMEEKRKLKQKEKEEKKSKFWDYEFDDKHRQPIQPIRQPMVMRMLRNWNGGKNSSPLRQARQLIQEVLFQDVI